MRTVVLSAFAAAFFLGAVTAALPSLAQRIDEIVVPPVSEKSPESPPGLDTAVPVQEVQPGEGTVPESADPGEIEIEVPPIARTVTFAGNTLFSGDELLSISGIVPGQLITEQVLGAAITRIEQAYQDRGYIAAVVGVDLPGSGEVGALAMDIAELEIVDVRIEGLRKVREDLLRRVLAVEPGELYSRQQVSRDVAQLRQLGVFESISYDLLPVRPAEAALVWQLEELEKFNYVEIGGSYSPQDNLVGSAQLTLGNLAGRAQKLTLLAEVSSVESQFGGLVRYYNPWVASQSTSLLVEAFSVPRYRFSRDIAEGAGLDRYYERRSGFRGVVTRVPNPVLTLAAGLRYESVDVNNLPIDLLTNTSAQDTDVLLASLRSTWDHRNSFVSPTSGTYTVAFVEGGYSETEAAGSDGIGKLWGDRRWYMPLRSSPEAEDELVPVLAARLLLAGSAGDLPFFEQYFVGGLGDLPLRGYLEDRFWGRYAVLANLEYRRPFTRDLVGVAFVDLGDAWDSDYQFAPGAGVDTSFAQHDGFSPRVGGGIGVRYATPFGPVRLDLAYGDSLRLHFSVGQDF